METKLDIRQLSLEQLIIQIADLGEKKFRARQIYEWLWKKRATDFNQMTNLTKSLRETLKEHFIINEILLQEAQKSKDKNQVMGTFAQVEERDDADAEPEEV